MAVSEEKYNQLPLKIRKYKMVILKQQQGTRIGNSYMKTSWELEMKDTLDTTSILW